MSLRFRSPADIKVFGDYEVSHVQHDQRRKQYEIAVGTLTTRYLCFFKHQEVVWVVLSQCIDDWSDEYITDYRYSWEIVDYFTDKRQAEALLEQLEN